MSFTFLNELPSPAQIQERYPLSEKLQELKKQRDAEISNVIKGLDNRFLVIIGPCSADNEDSVCDYVSRLTSIQEDVKDKLFIRVSSAEANKEVLEIVPHQLKEDLAITYHVAVGKNHRRRLQGNRFPA